jgi:hypothetical protein
MARPTLEEIEARHAAATCRKAAGALRQYARRIALEGGLEIPAWAARQAYVRPAKAKRTPRDREPKEGGFGMRRVQAKRVPATVDHAIEVPRDIPAALREWRARTPGAIVQVSRTGVVVHLWQRPPLAFPDLPSAVAELCG